jgi:outer membrane lipoprotein SlyB
MNTRLIAVATLASCLAAAGCATSPGYGSNAYGTSAYGSSAYGNPPTGACYNDCGVVTRVEVISAGSSSVPNATGAVVGGVVGAAAGRAAAGDESKGRQNTATVVGAAAGALIGNAIQTHAQANNGGVYRITVRLDDGRTTYVDQTDLAGLHEGSAVRIYNGRAWAR